MSKYLCIMSILSRRQNIWYYFNKIDGPNRSELLLLHLYQSIQVGNFDMGKEIRIWGTIFTEYYEESMKILLNVFEIDYDCFLVF